MLSLSKVYVALRNSFYYGEFMYGNKRYKGNYEPIISKQIFEKYRYNSKLPQNNGINSYSPSRKYVNVDLVEGVLQRKLNISI